MVEASFDSALASLLAGILPLLLISIPIALVAMPVLMAIDERWRAKAAAGPSRVAYMVGPSQRSGRAYHASQARDFPDPVEEQIAGWLDGGPRGKSSRGPSVVPPVAGVPPEDVVIRMKLGEVADSDTKLEIVVVFRGDGVGAVLLETSGPNGRQSVALNKPEYNKFLSIARAMESRLKDWRA